MLLMTEYAIAQTLFFGALFWLAVMVGVVWWLEGKP